MDQKISRGTINTISQLYTLPTYWPNVYHLIFRGSGEIFFGVFRIFSGKKLRENNHEKNYGNCIFDAKLSAIVKTKYFFPFLGFGCTHFILTVFGS